MGLISWIVIGVVVGFAGKVAFGRRAGSAPMIAGVAGALAGGILAALFGASVLGFSLAGAVTALVVAVLAMVPARMIAG